MDNNKTVAEMEVRAKFFSKMSRITGSVINLKKDATNKFHKYNYVSADGVLQAIAPLMAKENIALISETLEVGIDDKVYMPKYQFTFVCGDTGYMLPCIWFGETVHTSQKGTRDDKALNKSATIAQKYFLLKTFMIATGDDPDGHEGDKGNEQSTQSKWPSKNTVTWVMEHFAEENISNTEVYDLAGVKGFDDGNGWRKYKTPQAAVSAINTALDSALQTPPDPAFEYDDSDTDASNGDRPAVWNCKFTHKAYEVVGKKTCLKFANCDPNNGANEGNVIIANVYDRSKVFRAMIGDYAYDALNLTDYDDAEKTTAFTQIPPPLNYIELEYVEKTIQKGRGKGTVYNEIIGVVGNDDSF